MHVFLTTLGCRLNEAEIGRWARAFRAAGHTIVATPGQADLMVVNTCAVTGEAARKSRKLTNGLHRQNPAARMVLTGCFAELDPVRAAALAGVDLVVSNRDKDGLVAKVTDILGIPTMTEMSTEADSTHMYRHGGRTRAFVKVQDGCRNRCTFCVVTVARGSERSQPIAAVVDEINQLHATGYQEAVLTGVHLGGYGSELGVDLYTLVERVLRDTAIPRLRLSSLEPWDLPAHFFTLWRDPRLMPHLHLPLQSGSDTVLKRMARRCTTAAYARLVADARAAIAELTLTTDIIVGFPGETEAEWAETTDYVQRIGFGHTHVFSYSPRHGTGAARLAGQLPGSVKRARSRALHQLAGAMKQAHLQRFVGQVRHVLWEGAGVPVPAAAGAGGHSGSGRPGDLCRRWTGYTDNYLRVTTIAPAAVDLENRIRATRLIGVAGDMLCGAVLSTAGDGAAVNSAPPPRGTRMSLPVLTTTS